MYNPVAAVPCGEFSWEDFWIVNIHRCHVGGLNLMDEVASPILQVAWLCNCLLSFPNVAYCLLPTSVWLQKGAYLAHLLLHDELEFLRRLLRIAFYLDLLLRIYHGE
jgi:hypothetical protein